jgi:hypothetical protein
MVLAASIVVIAGSNHFGISIMSKDQDSCHGLVDIYVIDIPYPLESWLPCKVDKPQSLEPGDKNAPKRASKTIFPNCLDQHYAPLKPTA